MTETTAQIAERIKERDQTPWRTDAGNAARLVFRHGQNIRYVAEDKEWYVWNGSYWERDTLDRIMELAKETIRSILTEDVPVALDGNDKDHAEALAKWVMLSLSSSKLSAMVRLAQSIPSVAISAVSLDTDPYLLNCKNGTLDLRTGELYEPERDDLITKSTKIKHDAHATCDGWEAFISWAMQDRSELIEFLQLGLGMSLTGDVSERLIFFLHGGGKNGKSTLLKVARHVMGDYAIRVSADILEAATFSKGGGSASPHIADLKGKRFMTTSEVEDGTRLAVALLKDMTGDETLRGRHLYKNSFEFYPEFTPWIGANYKPDAPADDQALWDRMRLVPFDARVDEDEMDKDLGKNLMKKEATGILAWCVRGCLQWQESGMTTPQVVMEATDDYRASQDTFADWLAYALENEQTTIFTPSAMRDEYNTWAKENDAEKMTQRQYKANMEARGWRQVVTGDRSSRLWTPPKKTSRVTDWVALAAAAESHSALPPETYELPDDWEDSYVFEQ